MSALPKAFQGLDWTGWTYISEPDGKPQMSYTFWDAERCVHDINIYKNNFFEVVNVDGEVSWNATFQSVRSAHRAANAIIEGMGE